jgi:hypothetical protein
MMNSVRVLAQRITRPHNSHYLFSISIETALSLLEIPDPSHPFPDNRRVSKKHAMDFGNYWEKHETDWIVPPLLLDSAIKLEYRSSKFSNEQSEVVELELTKGDREVLRILDGQHRVLGWYLKKLELESRLKDSVSLYNKLLIENSVREAELIVREIDHIELVISRMKTEKISVNLLDSLSQKLHQQFFVDIAKNALGINKTVQSKFDTASIINRVTQSLIRSHPLLENNVDLEKTSCSGSNPNILTVVNVSDITRHACFGIASRVTERKENTFSDSELETNVRRFLDIIQESIPQLAEIVNRRITAGELRENYLIGSGTIWRCLAGTFYEACVIVDEKDGTIQLDENRVNKFERFIRKFSMQMDLPISDDWFGTALFPLMRSKAPSSRTQDLLSMVSLMTAWTLNGELFEPPSAEFL